MENYPQKQNAAPPVNEAAALYLVYRLEPLCGRSGLGLRSDTSILRIPLGIVQRLGRNKR
jgi:hypothetical protein